MNTFLSAAQQSIKEQYETYAREVIEPLSEQLEEGTACLKGLLQKLGQEGYLGLTVPKEYGGQGLPFLNAVLFAEAIGNYQPSVAVAIAEQTAVIELINRFGTDTQRSRYLPLLARGECLAATAFNEESAGTDFKSISTTVQKQDAVQTLSGKKTVVVNGGSISLIVASALLGDCQALEVFLVDLPSDAASFKVAPGRKMFGMQALELNDIELTAHKLSNDSLFPPGSNGGDEIIAYAGDIAKTLVASAAVGMAQRALTLSIDHANTREQFGQKLGQFQAVQWKVADMSMDISAARLLVYRAAWAKDEDPRSFRKDAATCKWYASKTARVHTGEAVQIFGVSGLYTDSVTERLYRDAKVSEICEGNAEFQKVLIAQELGI